MPMTYGLPEDEPERIDEVKRIVNEAIAGQGIVRRVVLYALTVALVVSPVAPLAVVPLVLLLATDRGLA